MQTTVLIVTLVLMAVVAFFFWSAVSASGGQPVAPGVNKRRMGLIWAMVLVGVLVSVASLREWPHAIAGGGDAVVVTVTGGQWWWEIDTTEVPLGRPVNFHVKAEDVNHGMGVYDADRRLLFQTQGMPGYVNKVTYTFDTPGTYQVLCMEYCGVAHHEMISEY